MQEDTKVVDEGIEIEAKEGFFPNVFSDVSDFIKTFEQETEPTPKIPSGKLLNLRKRLIVEEWEEIQDAIEDNDLAGYVDGCIDLIYVVAGALLAAGIKAEDAHKMWGMVHAANMAKAGGPTDANGKKLKPEGWMPPDIEGELERIKSRTDESNTD